MGRAVFLKEEISNITLNLHTKKLWRNWKLTNLKIIQKITEKNSFPEPSLTNTIHILFRAIFLCYHTVTVCNTNTSTVTNTFLSPSANLLDFSILPSIMRWRPELVQQYRVLTKRKEEHLCVVYWQVMQRSIRCSYESQKIFFLIQNLF